MKINAKKIAIIATACVLLIAIIAVVILYATGIIDYAKPAQSTNGKYLMVYFTGNEPDEERIRFAVSEDGYNFEPLNDNNPVIVQNLGTQSVRDPYIFKAQDGKGYYIIGTDMRSENGWASNNSFVIWYSSDLVEWKDERIIDVSEYGLPYTVRAWAPQVIWDNSVGKYMIYWANAQNDPQTGWTTTVMWYAYSSDLKTLDSEPQILYAPSNGRDAIDGDIVFKDGKYYMYYKDEFDKKICYVYSENVAGPYTEPEQNQVSVYYTNVEGNFIYNIAGTDEYVMMIDCYSDGKFVMQQTSDMVNFKRVAPLDYSLDFSPRHGSVIHISDSEYDLLINAFGK